MLFSKEIKLKNCFGMVSAWFLGFGYCKCSQMCISEKYCIYTWDKKKGL